MYKFYEWDLSLKGGLRRGIN